jgi:hypothetical protein
MGKEKRKEKGKKKKGKSDIVLCENSLDLDQ